MKRKALTLVSILIVVLVSACGSKAEPTLSAGDLASTAVANAWIALTATQAAMPTATATFLPTATFTPTATLPPVIIPTQPPIQAPIAVATATSQCNQVPPLKPVGTLINVEFKNDSDGSVNLSFGMNSPNSNGECVTYGYVFGKNDNIPTQVLAGCYWGYGWVTGDKNKTSTTQGTSLMCLTDKAVTYHIVIGKETIALK